jgi:hypothetical protein
MVSCGLGAWQSMMICAIEAWQTVRAGVDSMYLQSTPVLSTTMGCMGPTTEGWMKWYSSQGMRGHMLLCCVCMGALAAER